jgi:DNA-binding IclR family transcriptional regulator
MVEAVVQENGVAALDRAFSILDVFLRRDAPASLAELARETGLYKSTILRLLASITKFGLVTRLADGRYQLGPTAFRLGLAYEQEHSLVDRIAPVLERLVAAGCESASFHVPNDRTTRLCLARVDSLHATLDRIRAGDLLPLARGAAGRLILAFQGAPGADMARLREISVAISFGERDPACAGLACPVFGRERRFIGALSLSGPRERFTEPAIKRMTKLLRAAAEELSLPLTGGQAPRRAV